MKKMLDKYFHISEKGSTVGREMLGGLIVFFAMLYIFPVNSGILSQAGMSYDGVFAATAITSFIATFIMGLIAKYPVMLSAGMGMNAFLAFTVCGTAFGFTWIEAMALILIAGVLFLVITFTPIRTWIIEAMTKDLKLIISAGLGCFIAFVGLKMGGVIAANDGTLVSLGDLSNPVVLLSLFGIILVFALLMVKNKKVKQLAIVIAMFATALLGFILHLCGVANMPHFVDLSNGNEWTKAFSGLGDVFLKCFNGPAFVKVLSNPMSYAIIFSLLFVNLFDTTATLLAVGQQAGIINEKGDLIGGKKAMYADAVGSVICAPMGTSTVTSFAESTIAIESGAKTGLSAVTTSILFLVTLVIYPLFSVFSSIEIANEYFTPVTSMALVAVGAMMFSANLKDINWNDRIVTFTAFITITLMMLTYSLSNGLGIGLIMYVIMMLVAGRGKEIKPMLYAIALMFIVSFAVNAFIG